MRIFGHRPQWLRQAVLCGLLVSFALRLFRLGAQSLWYDETVSAVLASKPLDALFAHTAGDIHPPGYYLLLRGWQRLAQPSPAHGLEFLLAFFSLWFGLLVTALVYALGRRFFTQRVATLALWLTALHPFHIWYSQEVRMYTLAAALGLLCLWALHSALTSPNMKRQLVVYSLAAAAGLYTLYYFLFLLVAVNLIATLCYWQQRPQLRQTARVYPRYWIGAQLAVLLLWLPWLPTFWRQVIDPPVPPWRAPWSTWLEFWRSMSEALAALLIGQSAPGGVNWPWALVAIFMVVWALFALSDRRAVAVVLLYVFAPFALIVLISMTLTPLYHVRYLYPSAAFFPLLTAAVIGSLREWGRWRVGMAAVFVLVGSGWALHNLWTDVRQQRDDHRGAVAYLADAWRPGDVILVNAGWVYTALATYWPLERIGPWAAIPPAPSGPVRLLDVPSTGLLAVDLAPLIIRTGSVNGEPSLGWGNPASDFFAISEPDTIAALTTLATEATRIWHYRQYDTVSDPDGVTRAWLNDHATLALDLPFAGRDFLRLQRYDIAHASSAASALLAGAGGVAQFGAGLQLAQVAFEPSARAGERVYVTAQWRLAPGSTSPSALTELAASLRLYDESGALVAQEDSALAPPAVAWDASALYRTPLALSIPAAAKPALYDLRLVVYARQNAAPLPVTPAGRDPGMVDLGSIDVQIVDEPPMIRTRLATFDYLELVAVQPEQQHTEPGETLALTLVWRPRPNAYRDTYLARLGLQDEHGQLAQQWEMVLGGWTYPSGEWPPGIPVLDPHLLALPPALTDGEYTLTLQVVRAHDGVVIPARQGWLQPQPTSIVISRLTAGQAD